MLRAQEGKEGVDGKLIRIVCHRRGRRASFAQVPDAPASLACPGLPALGGEHMLQRPVLPPGREDQSKFLGKDVRGLRSWLRADDVGRKDLEHQQQPCLPRPASKNTSSAPEATTAEDDKRVPRQDHHSRSSPASPPATLRATTSTPPSACSRVARTSTSMPGSATPSRILVYTVLARPTPPGPTRDGQPRSARTGAQTAEVERRHWPGPG